MSEVVNLTKELLIRPSITTDDAGCQQLIAGRLQRAGFKCDHLRVGDVDHLWATHGDGAPTLVLRLARPPVLRNTLELRVREPLGDEERAKLREGDTTRVVSNLIDLPGDWVRWTQVFDPADEDATARVYALDEATGEIVFGEGEHGMIPPIGQDNIVAFRYQRTERAADDSESLCRGDVALVGAAESDGSGHRERNRSSGGDR